MKVDHQAVQSRNALLDIPKGFIDQLLRAVGQFISGKCTHGRTPRGKIRQKLSTGHQSARHAGDHACDIKIP